MTLEAEKIVSAEAFWEIVRLPENEGRKLELVNGEIIEMAGGTGGEHGEIAMEIGRHIANHVRAHGLGRVTAAETCYRLYNNPEGRDTVHCPDVGFVSKARAPEPFAAGFVPFAPDLAVEVISPGNEASEIHNKVLNYLKYGTRLIWVAYPESQTAIAYAPGDTRLLMPDDAFDGGDVLPDFRLPVRDVFPG